jgi:hypothetical protein
MNRTITRCLGAIVAVTFPFLSGCLATVDETAGAEVTATEEEAAFAFPGTAVLLRTYADLQFVGTISLYDWTDTQTYAVLPVKNIGNAPAYGGAAGVGRIYTSNVVQPAWLWNAKGQAVLGPGETGFIEVNLPIANARQCQIHTAQLDLDRKWQYDNYGTEVFNNDLAQLKAPCLSWYSPITFETLGSAPDPSFANKSLLNIVSSYDVGSTWGRCSDCHYKNTTSAPDYWPNVSKSQRQFIFPTQVVDEWRWAGPGGWAVRFGQNAKKPEALKKVFRTWVANGYPLN